ncbi:MULTISPECIES: Eco57I restriction-modification methylase domain-containing protein [Enterococcus]|uniref:Eco57I restriction-modification methylase domain-containing protein n=1 Tax=Enterococcus TaxID=1350 RepID=UPI001899304C|nr:Eco57I restriction-modification methylase domain-containing protein [Enterococcus mundtii]MBO1084962.1 hypothetical protein [Enterococcus mundtii]MDV7743782.1 Eco57I restriction-modification methylase domain-containing protein [Enterococcus mundtii]
MATAIYETEIIDELIQGYLPHSIYAFETNTYPNYLKVGDTNRKVSIRLAEWATIYENLEKRYEAEAMIVDENGEKTIFFRDYALHAFLEKEKKRERLSNTAWQQEFFKEATTDDLDEGLKDIKQEFSKEGNRKYRYYHVGEENSQVEEHWRPTKDYLPRQNQKEVIENIVAAVNAEKKNLLLYAVMRFGKSNVAIWAAQKLNMKLTVIVTGKADVEAEWQKTVESHKDFTNFVFTKANGFEEASQESENQDKNFVVFATLQDLAGSLKTVKKKHEFLFNQKIDFLVIDETHFGARAKVFGNVLKSKEDPDSSRFDGTVLSESQSGKVMVNVLSLNPDVTLHLSGTPYRILLSGEFDQAEIVGQIQFADILEAKRQWIKDHPVEYEETPWENDYFGFPEMLRFAFKPDKKSESLLNKLKADGASAELNILFQPRSTKDEDGATTKFTFESEVLTLLKAIDGSEPDENIFPFLDYDNIKRGKLTQHMVFVLPYKNSADAMERLLAAEKENFKNLNQYEILNVAGNTTTLKKVKEVTDKIAELDASGKKTITLTVNRMMTGVTVPEWDTMVFMKDTASPQEYDQAIYRLQSPWIKDILDKESDESVGKEDMKPQTLLIDFSPNRVFKIESERALIVNASKDRSGNDEQEKELQRSFQYSPIIYLNKNKLAKVTPVDIIKHIREYSEKNSIKDEALSLLIDFDLLNVPEIFDVIKKQPVLDPKKGLLKAAHEGNETELEIPEAAKDSKNNKARLDKAAGMGTDKKKDETKDIEKKMRAYYARILIYAFLTPRRVRNLSEIIDSIGSNERLTRHLALDKTFLFLMKERLNFAVRTALDNKIENIGELRSETQNDKITEKLARLGNISSNEVITPVEVAQKMVDALVTDEFIAEYKEQPKKILDLTAKSGVFLICAYQKLKAAGIAEAILKDNLYAVATSPMTYEFTRVVFETFGWNLDHLADVDQLSSQQIIKEKESTTIQKLKDGYGDENVKFDVLIGNPPYQEEAKGAGRQATPLYNLFVEAAKNLNSDRICMIIPSRWFAGGMGLNGFRKSMMNDKHLKRLVDYTNSKDCFPGISISGGVCYFLRDVNYYGDCKFTNITNSEKDTMVRPLNEFPVLVRYNKAVSIIHKVSQSGEVSLNTIMSPLMPYGLSTNYRGTSEPSSQDDLVLYASNGSTFISRSVITKGQDTINKYKILISKTSAEHAGEPGKDGKFKVIPSSMRVIGPNEVCTHSYFVMGAWDDKNIAENAFLYMKTRFVRLLGLLAISGFGLAKQTFHFVPLQDFTLNSDINWSLSIPEIDQQLYAKYGLSEEEINFIETKVKEME